jgi:hypothetical protein
MPDRVVRLGIDYGTSFSKVVFRDYGAPGGEKAYVIQYKGGFRTPSAVGVEDEEFIFGTDPHENDGTTWYQSVKMRVAGEVKSDYGRYYRGALNALPEGFTAKHLATLTVWFLISEGKRALLEHIRQSSTGTAVVGFSLGMPMSFYDDPSLRAAFLEIARVAWEISRVLSATERVSFSEARTALRVGREEIEKLGDLADDEIRDWVRTEAEAALWWPFQSPSVSEGPYAQIDIGAGTTNIAIFRIVPRHTATGWVKESLSFFGAVSPPVGMDAVDQALAEWRGEAPENSLAMRGRERRLLHGRMGEHLVYGVVKQLREAYRQTLLRAFTTHLQSRSERDSWHHHKVFFLGGGSEVDEIVKQLRMSPLPGDESTVLETAWQEKPGDLFMANQTGVTGNVVPHVAVAYGLSSLAAEIPTSETPSETPPMVDTDRYQRIDLDDWRY